MTGWNELAPSFSYDSSLAMLIQLCASSATHPTPPSRPFPQVKGAQQSLRRYYEKLLEVFVVPAHIPRRPVQFCRAGCVCSVLSWDHGSCVGLGRPAAVYAGCADLVPI